MSVLKESNTINDEEKKILEINYNVKIKSDINNKLIIKGGTEKNVKVVRNIIRRENFLKENSQSIPKFKSKEGSVSSKLKDYEINDKKNYKMISTHKSIKISI